MYDYSGSPFIDTRKMSFNLSKKKMIIYLDVIREQ